MAVVHIWTDYTPADEPTRQRMAIAQATWKNQPWRECPVRDEQLPRLWKEEGRQFAYIKDVFDFAAKSSKDNDIIIYTNADICVRTDCAAQITLALQQSEACYSFRRDFGPLKEPIPDSKIVTGHNYVGSDLKAFRKRWWTKHRHEMADMILGLEAWDPIMRILIADSNKGRTVEIPNTHYHQRHDSYWETSYNRYRLKGQVHCLRLAYAWLTKHGRKPEHFGVMRM